MKKNCFIELFEPKSKPTEASFDQFLHEILSYDPHNYSQKPHFASQSIYQNWNRCNILRASKRHNFPKKKEKMSLAPGQLLKTNMNKLCLACGSLQIIPTPNRIYTAN